MECQMCADDGIETPATKTDADGVPFCDECWKYALGQMPAVDLAERFKAESSADAKLLSLANHKNKFAIEIGKFPDLPLQRAFERGIDNEWFTLVDVTPVGAAPGKIVRVFRLTAKGIARRAALNF